MAKTVTINGFFRGLYDDRNPANKLGKLALIVPFPGKHSPKKNSRDYCGGYYASASVQVLEIFNQLKNRTAQGEFGIEVSLSCHLEGAENQPDPIVFVDGVRILDQPGVSRYKPMWPTFTGVAVTPVDRHGWLTVRGHFGESGTQITTKVYRGYGAELNQLTSAVRPGDKLSGRITVQLGAEYVNPVTETRKYKNILRLSALTVKTEALG